MVSRVAPEGRAAYVKSRARPFVNEKMLSYHCAADDVINAAIYDFCMNGKDSLRFKRVNSLSKSPLLLTYSRRRRRCWSTLLPCYSRMRPSWLQCQTIRNSWWFGLCPLSCNICDTHSRVGIMTLAHDTMYGCLPKDTLFFSFFLPTSSNKRQSWDTVGCAICVRMIAIRPITQLDWIWPITLWHCTICAHNPRICLLQGVKDGVEKPILMPLLGALWLISKSPGYAGLGRSKPTRRCFWSKRSCWLNPHWCVHPRGEPVR